MVSPLNFANKAKTIIPCPSIAAIQQTSSQLDRVGDDNPGYMAYTSDFMLNENNHMWGVAARNIIADSIDEALAIGKQNVAQISSVKTKNAIELPGEHIFYCQYEPRNIIAVTDDLNIARSRLHKIQ